MNFTTDPKTGCLVYNTLDKPGSTDPEVDSAYFTCYYYYFLILKSTDSITKLNFCRAFCRVKDASFIVMGSLDVIAQKV